MATARAGVQTPSLGVRRVRPVVGSRRPPSPSERPVTVAVVDGRPLILDALTALLDASGRFSVIASTGLDADPARIIAARPDVLLVAVGQEHDCPTRLVSSIHLLAPEVRIVILAESQDPGLIRCVFDEGVDALVLTAVTGHDLAITLERVLRGQTTLPIGWQRILGRSGSDPVESLSERQREVLSMLADGSTYDEVAERLFITVNTVKFHVRAIYQRLGVANRVAAVRMLDERRRSPRPW